MRDFIVFGEDYGRHPHCAEHLMNELVAENRIIWVETVGMRPPKLSFYDLKRSLEKLKKMSVKTNRVLPRNLTIVAPKMLPFTQWRWVRAFNRAQVKRAVKKEMERRGFGKPILITTIPSTCDFVGILGESLAVYYCVDEFTQWPGIPAELVKTFEQKLLSKVDAVMATSKALQASRQVAKHPTELLTHGVDAAHFLLPTRNQVTSVGYFGLIDERLDQELVAETARLTPEIQFVFIGPIVTDVSKLFNLENVDFRPAVPYAKLPAAIEDIDAFMLPYRKNEQTRNIHPLKIKEYLATGRPVLATSLDELSDMADLIFFADEAETFSQALKGLHSGLLPTSPEKNISRASAETWSAKAREFSKWIAEWEAAIGPR